MTIADNISDPSASSDRSFLGASHFRSISRASAALVASAGSAIVLGWCFNLTYLKAGFTSGINVKANTGIAFLLAGLSLWLATRDRSWKIYQACAMLLAAAVFLIGILTLSEHVFGWNAHLDQLLFREPPGQAATMSPNRMGPPASVCFVMGGIALLMLSDRRTTNVGEPADLSSLLAIAMGFVVLFPTLGYLFGAKSLYGIARYTGIALPTAITFILLATGILCAAPGGRVLSLLRSPTAGGVLVRRLLLPAIFLPPLLGYLRTVGERVGFYDAPTGRALLIISVTLVFGSLVWLAGRKLDSSDRAHRKATDASKSMEAARELSEAKFELLANTIPQLAWMANADGWIFWYNQRWHDYCGTTPQDMEGWGWQRVHDPVILPQVLANWNASIASGEPFDMEFPLKGADGVFRPFLTRVMPLRDGAGRVLFWFGTNTDMTAQTRAREEREQLLESERAARADAERAGRLKDEFLATLSHELRTPLNAILGWSQLLRGHNRQDEELDEGLAVIERNSRVQAQLIEDLLDMSRIISGKLRMDVQQVNIAEITNAAIEAVSPTAEAKGIRLEKVLDTHSGPIRGDPARLQQVIWNLLSNALKFTPKGGKVQIALARINSHVEITVTDTGAGIKPEFLPFVFERFRQADSTTTRKHGGLGIGLAIVKNLVELHGGRVRAKSAGENLGATFIIELPLAVLHASEAYGIREHPRRSEMASQSDFDESNVLAGVSVLVVDDEEDARNLVARLLQECKATVTTAASSVEALQILKQVRPTVILSDIGMPGEDGYEFIEKVRMLSDEHGGKTPAAALTAFARSEDRTRVLRAGYQSHVAKPVEPAELVAVVASLAGRS